ncbi:capsular biosynthesis protein [bacterium LRH843]|nr:capsular biosynthesis protein [bacterium LRH843]
MEETISLREIYDTLKKRIVMIIIITACAVGASGIVSYFVLTPIYQASTQILVSQQAAGAASALQAAGFDVDSKYIQTYNVIMKSPYILDQVIDELDLPISHRQLNGQLSVSQEGQSQVVTIRVEDASPALAADIANTTAQVFQREISNLLRIDNVVILAEAELLENPTPIKPNPELNMAIAFVVGLMAAVGLAFLLEYLDQSIRTEQDIEQYLELPVIGAIAKMDESDDPVHTRSKRLGSESNVKKKSAS